MKKVLLEAQQPRLCNTVRAYVYGNDDDTVDDNNTGEEKGREDAERVR